jgi:DNA helicase-2/ATP-dependent DNA helicase PcrA
MEDELRPFSPLGAPTRSALDRSFDDLLRMYFVAFSRPESVLLLVGTKKSSPFGSIKNIAAGYDRKGNSHLSSRTLLREI